MLIFPENCKLWQRRSSIASTNSISLRRDYLFVDFMVDEESVWGGNNLQILFLFVIIFAMMLVAQTFLLVQSAPV